MSDACEQLMDRVTNGIKDRSENPNIKAIMDLARFDPIVHQYVEIKRSHFTMTFEDALTMMVIALVERNSVLMDALMKYKANEKPEPVFVPTDNND